MKVIAQFLNMYVSNNHKEDSRISVHHRSTEQGFTAAKKSRDILQLTTAAIVKQYSKILYHNTLIICLIFIVVMYGYCNERRASYVGISGIM